MIVRAAAELGPLARELGRHQIPVEVAGDEVALAGQPAVAALLLALQVAASGGQPDPDATRRLLAGPLVGLDGVAQRRLARDLRARANRPRPTPELLGAALEDPELLAGCELPEAAALSARPSWLMPPRRSSAPPSRTAAIRPLARSCAACWAN